MLSTLIIFDGSNFYHKAKKLSPEIHLTNFDYRKLSEALADNKNITIEYCVGEIKREKNEKSKKIYNGQMALFDNLRKQKIIIKKGFMMKRKFLS